MSTDDSTTSRKSLTRTVAPAAQQPTAPDQGRDLPPMTNPTPAVQRAMVVLGNQDPGWTRDALAAALDVEEMAQAIHEFDQGPDVWGMEGEKFKDMYRANARAVRKALLGGAA